MMEPNLETTNLLLGIMAVTSVLEALALMAAGVFGYRMYRTAMHTVEDLERRQIEPLVANVNNILADIKEITGRVSDQTERVDHAIRGTIERVDETADRVRTNVRDKAGTFVRAILTVRGAIEQLLTSSERRRPPATPHPRFSAAGRGA